MKRLKLRTRKGNIRNDILYGYGDELDKWIADKIPLPPPEGTLCECSCGECIEEN